MAKLSRFASGLSFCLAVLVLSTALAIPAGASTTLGPTSCGALNPQAGGQCATGTCFLFWESCQGPFYDPNPAPNGRYYCECR